MRTFILLISSLFFLITCSLSAAEQQEQLDISFEFQYLSQWLSKGAPAYGKHGAVFGIVDVDFWNTGFGVSVTHRNATSSGYVDKQRFDYRPYFKSLIFEGTPYQINYNISAGYEHYYGLDKNTANTTWEWIGAFSWPNLLPKGLVPSYIVHYEYPAVNNNRFDYHFIRGWVHRFILGYDMNVPELPAPLHFSSEVAYTDGLGGADHDWSYATFGIATKLKINENLTFTPGIYQQISMDDSVCKRDDVTYCILSMKYNF